MKKGLTVLFTIVLLVFGLSSVWAFGNSEKVTDVQGTQLNVLADEGTTATLPEGVEAGELPPALPEGAVFGERPELPEGVEAGQLPPELPEGATFGVRPELPEGVEAGQLPTLPEGAQSGSFNQAGPGFGNQSFGNQGFGNQNFGNQGFGAPAPGGLGGGRR